jgi:hypothetical protein
LALIYNWDDGNTVPRWIIDSPLCAKATGHLLFWLTRPDYYMQYSLDDNPTSSSDAEVLKLIAAILDKDKRNAYSSYKIAFDPEEYLEEVHEKDPKWSIPQALYQKLEGVSIYAEDDED